MRTLYVGGLAPDASEASLREVFSSYGRLEAARVVMRSSTGECRGFGYVTFIEELEAKKAMFALNGEVVHGNKWRVEIAR